VSERKAPPPFAATLTTSDASASVSHRVEASSWDAFKRQVLAVLSQIDEDRLSPTLWTHEEERGERDHEG